MATDRVAQARKHCEERLKARCAELHVAYPPSHVFIRAYKQEREMEVWVGSGKKYELFNTYAIAAASGGPGPKRVEGDNQVPEGVYHVAVFNPQSQFLLSLGLNYPNTSDKHRSDLTRPGGQIYIHGNRLSIGCMAMTDEKIEEIYLLALGGKKNGVPVYVFPARMLSREYRDLKTAHPEFASFWEELEPVDAAIENLHRPAIVSVGSKGEYRVVLKHSR